MLEEAAKLRILETSTLARSELVSDPQDTRTEETFRNLCKCKALRKISGGRSGGRERKTKCRVKNFYEETPF